MYIDIGKGRKVCIWSVQPGNSSQGSGQSTRQVEVKPSAVCDACLTAVMKASPCYVSMDLCELLSGKGI